MHIFIDESGTFKPGNGRTSSLSAVGALIVPTSRLRKVERSYETLRRSLPTDRGEVKGRLLNETEVRLVLEMLHREECVFEAVLLDHGLETAETIDFHIRGQAEALTRNLTDRHQPGLVADVWELRAKLEEMPRQLYAQSVAVIQLVGSVLRYLPAYWLQRAPKEALTFNWVIDGKAVNAVTDAEEWWSKIMLGLLQTSSHREPMIVPSWVDHSAFDAKFTKARPEWLQRALPGPQEGLDLQLLLKESFRFSSGAEPGLELVDVATNCLRRAVVGNLARRGLAPLPNLMIDRRSECLSLIALSDQRPERPYNQLLVEHFRRGGRSLVAK